jgi:hypothetical protein
MALLEVDVEIFVTSTGQGLSIRAEHRGGRSPLDLDPRVSDAEHARAFAHLDGVLSAAGRRPSESGAVLAEIKGAAREYCREVGLEPLLLWLDAIPERSLVQLRHDCELLPLEVCSLPSGALVAEKLHVVRTHRRWNRGPHEVAIVAIRHGVTDAVDLATVCRVLPGASVDEFRALAASGHGLAVIAHGYVEQRRRVIEVGQGREGQLTPDHLHDLDPPVLMFCCCHSGAGHAAVANGITFITRDNHASRAQRGGCRHVLAGLFELPTVTGSQFVAEVLSQASSESFPNAWRMVRERWMASRLSLPHKLTLVGLAYFSDLEALVVRAHHNGECQIAGHA